MLSSATYMIALLFSICGVSLIDWRYKLAFAKNRKAALLTTLIPLAFFLIWDGTGIGLGIFFRGQTSHLTGLVLAPELPLEEIFFLFLLNYTSLCLYVILQRKWGKK